MDRTRKCVMLITTEIVCLLHRCNGKTMGVCTGRPVQQVGASSNQNNSLLIKMGNKYCAITPFFGVIFFWSFSCFKKWIEMCLTTPHFKTNERLGTWIGTNTLTAYTIWGMGVKMTSASVGNQFWLLCYTMCHFFWWCKTKPYMADMLCSFVTQQIWCIYGSVWRFTSAWMCLWATGG